MQLDRREMKIREGRKETFKQKTNHLEPMETNYLELFHLN